MTRAKRKPRHQVENITATHGSRISHENAQKVSVELDRILSTNGELTALGVLDDARDPKSTLHSHFTWDDSEAAEAHRLHEARQLIRSVSVIMWDEERGERYSPRKHISVRQGSVRSYEHVATILSDAELRAQVVKRGLKELESWCRRYQIYDELSDAIDTIEKLVEDSED